jgi:uncharacterized protein (TIGR03067 family)
MKTITAFALGLGLVGFFGLGAVGQEKKPDAPKLEGKYTLVAGKINGKAIDEDAKKAEYTFTADQVTVKGKDIMFVMGYKIDPRTDPMNVDMAIADGTEGSKGTKAQGIIEVKGDTVKLAYSTEKEKRPKDFKGEKDFYFELKKAK